MCRPNKIYLGVRLCPTVLGLHKLHNSNDHLVTVMEKILFSINTYSPFSLFLFFHLITLSTFSFGCKGEIARCMHSILFSSLMTWTANANVNLSVGFLITETGSSKFKNIESVMQMCWGLGSLPRTDRK